LLTNGTETSVKEAQDLRNDIRRALLGIVVALFWSTGVVAQHEGRSPAEHGMSQADRSHEGGGAHAGGAQGNPARRKALDWADRAFDQR
jgi:hypothetical protein